MKKRTPLLILSVLLVASLAIYLWREYMSAPVPLTGISEIVGIYILSNENGVETTQSIWGNEISTRLEQDLRLSLNSYSRTRGQVRRPEVMEITDPYLYFALRVRSEEGDHFWINISNIESHSAVKFGKKNYGIINRGELLEEIKSILEYP